MRAVLAETVSQSDKQDTEFKGGSFMIISSCYPYHTYHIGRNQPLYISSSDPHVGNRWSEGLNICLADMLAMT